jgi:cytochrome c oxidase subunit 2
VNLPVLRRGRTVAGLLAVAACLVAGIAAAASSSPKAPPDEPRVIEIIAKRYVFEPAEVEVREGERVRLLVKSGDGLHGFEIKQFKISKEIPRGTTPVTIDFTATTAGRFPILCSIFCGDGHDAMKGTLIVTALAAQP